MDPEIKFATKQPLKQTTVEVKKKSFFKSKAFIVIALVILIITLGISGFFGYQYLSKKSDVIADNNNNEEIVEPTPTPTPEPIFYPNPITGVMIPEAEYQAIKDRPFMAVMIQNNIASRPEYALNEADIVYETLVESGITRFMAIYWSEDAPRVQSLRSARKYYVDLLGDYSQPVYMHIGYSTGDPKIDAYQAMNKYGIRRIGDLRDKENTAVQAFSRDKECEKIKAVEHCAYTDTARLWKIAAQQGWANDLTKMQSWKFDDAIPTTYPSVDLTEFKSNFVSCNGCMTSTNYSVLWRYDAISKKYLRFNVDNTPYVQYPGTQVSTDTIIYQKITSTPQPNDNKGHQYQEVIGTGDAHIMSGGKVYEVTWKKTSFTDKTKYYDKASGQEFIFPRGKVWVMLMPKTYDYTL